MFELKLISHKNLTQKYLDEIIQIKSIAWPYSYDKQLDWIHSNLKDTDIHFLLYFDESIVAYLNLLEIRFTIDGIPRNGFGIGNVCAKEKGKGWGKELIIQTNSYLTQREKVGLLFCKNFLVNFYSLNNWLLIEKKKLTLLFNNESIETMIFNLENRFKHLEFLGKSF